MNFPLFIESAVAISPQESFRPEAFLREPYQNERGWLALIDAPYQEYINPVAIRRMSRILKVAISAAMEAMRSSGVGKPDAIITGTGRGVITDMEHFVKDMVRLKEATLNPTLFIQSTYNSANGWIAMQTKCQGYNQTYVHRGISFELALQDSMLLLAESGPEECVLCGCFDEMTPEHYHIYGKLGTWRKPPVNSIRLFGAEAVGTIGGEGAAFFVLCRERRNAATRITGMRIVYEPASETILGACEELLEAERLTWDDVDLLVSGFNGDMAQAHLYTGVHDAAGHGGGHVFYKHLVGEYDTSTGFGLWLGDWILRTGRVPEPLGHTGNPRSTIRTVLVLNTYEQQTAGIMLLRAASH